MSRRMILILACTFATLTSCDEAFEGDDERDGGRAERVEDAAGPEGTVTVPVALLSRSTVSLEAAVATALREVEGGRIVEGELEMEDGEIVYSFDLRIPGTEGVEEVHVDAGTGEVIAREHEDAEDERAERDEEEAGERGDVPEAAE